MGGGLSLPGAARLGTSAKLGAAQVAPGCEPRSGAGGCACHTGQGVAARMMRTVAPSLGLLALLAASAAPAAAGGSTLRQSFSLDGTWKFALHAPTAANVGLGPAVQSGSIAVPGSWEAQGYVRQECGSSYR